MNYVLRDSKRYLTCQTVGELREALHGLRDDMALFGDQQGDRYISITIDHDDETGDAVIVEAGPLVEAVVDRICDESSAYCNGYEAARQGMVEARAIANAQRSHGDALVEHFRQGFLDFRVEAL